MEKSIKVLSIGYGRHLFDSGNVERQRLVTCSEAIEEQHMIVFSLKEHNLDKDSIGKLILYPTNSPTRFHMLLDAIHIGITVITQNKANWVLTSQDPFAAGLVAWVISKRTNTALNIQEHGDFFSTKYWKYDEFLNFFWYILGKFILKQADTVRVVSQRIKHTVASLGISERHILLLPVRSDFVAKEVTAARVRQIKTEFADKFLIVTMGRFVSQKNFPLLIKAFANLLKKKPLAQLVLIGKGSEESSLKKLVSSLKLDNNVTFHPWTEHPLEFIAAADVFALSSYWEGWARVLVEAMSVGTPIVTTDVGCAGEVIKDGVHGYIVPINNLNAYSEKLLHISELSSVRNLFKENSLRDSVQYASTSDEYAEHWAEVLKRTHTLHQAVTTEVSSAL